LITVERADFVSVPVQDMERAKRFYSETLGIHSPNLDERWPEFETGSVSIYLVDPTQIGAEFKPHGSHIALRVLTSPSRASSSKGPASSSRERSSTRVCVTWRSSRTARATR
jgi:catechol 2,3-dioxygenase-like lactoylglutathione lyase family enzyme